MSEAIQLESLVKRLPDLETLFAKVEASKLALDEAIKAVAQNSRIDKSVIKKFLAERMSEKFEEAKEKAQQLSLLFDEIQE